MKLSYLHFFIFILFFIEISHCQVGINTSSPRGIFHVDPKNNTSGVANTDDDVVVTSKGYLGIGTITPEVAVHLKTTGTQTAPISAFKLQDGSEGLGKYLVSDATGVGSWTDGSKNTVRGVLGAGASVNLYDAQQNGLYYDTKSYIDLPVGRWIVYVVMRAPIIDASDTSSYWIRSTFSDSNTIVTASSNIVGSILISGLSLYNSKGIVYGFIIIENNTGLSKRYYYAVGGFEPIVNTSYAMLYGGNSYSENNIVAYQLKK